jgi:predicted small metal-binding protein
MSEEPLVEEVSKRINDHLNEILTLFKPGVKLTFLARTPGKPDCDFLMTADDLNEVEATIKRRAEEANG